MRMSTQTSTASTLTFEAFWRWLADHRHCILRVAAGDVSLMDHELIHWDFFDEDDGRAVCQVNLGKTLVGELLIDRAELLFVQATPGAEGVPTGSWTFECIGGPRDDSYPLYTFVLSHGMEGAAGHQLLKH